MAIDSYPLTTFKLTDDTNVVSFLQENENGTVHYSYDFGSGKFERGEVETLDLVPQNSSWSISHAQPCITTTSGTTTSRLEYIENNGTHLAVASNYLESSMFLIDYRTDIAYELQRYEEPFRLVRYQYVDGRIVSQLKEFNLDSLAAIISSSDQYLSDDVPLAVVPILASLSILATMVARRRRSS